MKLVKLLDKVTPEIIGSTKVGLPEGEQITLKEDLLVSDDRFTLLQHNHIKMMLVQDFSEVAVANLGNFDKNKTYLIKKRIQPSKFSAFDPATFEEGDYVFVYAKPEEVISKFHKMPIFPVMPKPDQGMKFSPSEYVKNLNEYNKEMKKYNEDLELYETDIKKFIDEEASLKEFGWLIKIVSKTQFEVIADFSFETTKTEDQFGALGKLPKEVATKITQALGGFAKEDSIKGLTIADILTKALGLEAEEELVGKILPEEVPEKVVPGGEGTEDSSEPSTI